MNFTILKTITSTTTVICIAIVFILSSCNKDETNPVTKDVTDGLVAKFTFDSGDIKDAIGSLTGTNMNGEFNTSTFNGEGKALSMSGLDNNQIAYVSDSIINQSADFSISTWFNLSSINSNQSMYLVTSRHSLLDKNLEEWT